MVLQLFVAGPPGSGKTTLAKLLCEEFRLQLVATGDLLRDNMAAKTPSGREAQRCITTKTLVPDRVVLDMVAAKVASCYAQGRAGWVLDSFPRTIEQAEMLMGSRELCPSIVLLLELPEDACATRICGRRFDPVTGEIFHSPMILPQDAAIRARLTRRRDDVQERLAPRFEAYRTFGQATNKLFADRLGVVHRIDASKPAKEILENVSVLLHSLATHLRSHLGGGNNQQLTQRNIGERKLSQCRPETIVEVDEEDDDVQQYQYDWEDESVGVRQGHSKKQTKGKQHQPDKKAIPQPLNALSSSFMAALPVPELPPPPSDRILGDNNDTARPPPPAPAPALRALPMPVSRFNSLQNSAASSALPSPRFSDNNRSSSSSSSCASITRSNSSSSSVGTNLEAAAAVVDMEAFKELLRDGFEVVKHGRRGRPHPRLVFTDIDLKRVFWQKALGPAAKVGKGKYARLEQSLALADVMQVTRGMKTAVLKRSGNVARYERYVSLVTPTRTLDLELPSAQLADFLQRGFDQLLHE